MGDCYCRYCKRSLSAYQQTAFLECCQALGLTLPRYASHAAESCVAPHALENNNYASIMLQNKLLTVI